MSARQVLRLAGLPASYHMYDGGDGLVSMLPAHAAAWVDSELVGIAHGHQVVSESADIDSDYTFGSGQVSYGPQGEAQVLVVNSGHGLWGFYFPSSCGDTNEPGSDPVSNPARIAIRATIPGTCASYIP